MDTRDSSELSLDAALAVNGDSRLSSKREQTGDGVFLIPRPHCAARCVESLISRGRASHGLAEQKEPNQPFKAASLCSLIVDMVCMNFKAQHHNDHRGAALIIEQFLGEEQLIRPKHGQNPKRCRGQREGTTALNSVY